MEFPIGYHKFHKSKFLNYQLNRWHSLGYARKSDLEKIGARIKTFEDYTQGFIQASELARKEERLKNAATYLRAAEFLVSPTDKLKLELYRNFIQLFDHAFADESFSRYMVPYNGSFLSAIKIPSKTNEVKGTIVGIPGFDAFIEEFYAIWNYFTFHGYEVIAFEGPGQGGSLRTYGQNFDHDYEKPMKAVLDHFSLEQVTALGISMGGYWILRAAAYEKRIQRVIAMPPVYDWLEMTHGINQMLARWFRKKQKLTNLIVKQKMAVGTLKHTVNNALFIQGKVEPFEAVEWMMQMNKEHLSSHLIDQDVLLLAGERDAFQPLVLQRKQKAALLNARSISERIFTKAESADQHCQMGNLGLALKVMLTWIEEKNLSNLPKTS